MSSVCGPHGHRESPDLVVRASILSEDWFVIEHLSGGPADQRARAEGEVGRRFRVWMGEEDGEWWPDFDLSWGQWVRESVLGGIYLLLSADTVKRIVLLGDEVPEDLPTGVWQAGDQIGFVPPRGAMKDEDELRERCWYFLPDRVEIGVPEPSGPFAPPRPASRRLVIPPPAAWGEGATHVVIDSTIETMIEERTFSSEAAARDYYPARERARIVVREL